MKIKKFFITICLPVAVLVFVILLFIYGKGLLKISEVSYCKELSYKLYFSNFECFKFRHSMESNGIIHFFFDLKNDNEYDYYNNYGIMDMQKVSRIIDEYLSENPNNPLNNKKICCTFYLLPGDGMQMYNYDYKTENAERFNDFSFYNNLYVETSSVLCELQNVKSIKAYIKQIDSLNFVEEWENIERLHFVSSSFTEEQCDYLRDVCSQCDLILSSE